MLVELRRSMRQKIKLPTARCDEIVEFMREHMNTFVSSGEPIVAAVDDEDARVIGESHPARRGLAYLPATCLS